MRLIHCADLHLDSKMTTNLSGEKAKERKKELLLTFQRMIAYAAEHDVSAILIAGDLFDTRNISATARHVVWDAIDEHPDISFFYLKGNHDTDAFLSSRDTLPAHFHTFGSAWTSHPLGERIVVSGLELSADNAGSAYHSLVLSPEKFHIVMLHGQQAKTGGKDTAEVIRLRELKNKGIDYLALGHVHFYQEGTLDGRGVWCYPGCLEGRGFDECGPHGFVLLDVDESAGTCTRQFVPFAARRLFEVSVDVSDCEKPSEILSGVQRAIYAMGKEQTDCADSSGLQSSEPLIPTSRDLLKIRLMGEVDVERDTDTEYIRKVLESAYYFVKVSDETTPKVDVSRFALDASLKGEFVRTVLAREELSKEDAAAIIRIGLRAIAGEEVLGCD